MGNFMSTRELVRRSDRHRSAPADAWRVAATTMVVVGLAAFVGWLRGFWQTERQRRELAAMSGRRWCDATERYVIDELTGLHRRPARHQ